MRSPIQIKRQPPIQPAPKGYSKVQVELPSIDEVLAELQTLKARLEAVLKQAEGSLGHIQSIRPLKGEKGDTPLVDYPKIVSEVVKQIPDPPVVKVPKKEHIVAEVLKHIPAPKEPEIPVINHSELASVMIKKILDEKLLTPDHVSGLESTLASYRSQFAGGNGYVHGGGDTLKAGAGQSLVRNPDGTTTLVIPTTSFTIMVPTGTSTVQIGRSSLRRLRPSL